MLAQLSADPYLREDMRTLSSQSIFAIPEEDAYGSYANDADDDYGEYQESEPQRLSALNRRMAFDKMHRERVAKQKMVHKRTNSHARASMNSVLQHGLHDRQRSVPAMHMQPRATSASRHRVQPPVQLPMIHQSHPNLYHHYSEPSAIVADDSMQSMFGMASPIPNHFAADPSFDSFAHSPNAIMDGLDPFTGPGSHLYSPSAAAAGKSHIDWNSTTVLPPLPTLQAMMPPHMGMSAATSNMRTAPFSSSKQNSMFGGVPAPVHGGPNYSLTNALQSLQTSKEASRLQKLEKLAEMTEGIEFSKTDLTQARKALEFEADFGALSSVPTNPDDGLSQVFMRLQKLGAQSTASNPPRPSVVAASPHAKGAEKEKEQQPSHMMIDIPSVEHPSFEIPSTSPQTSVQNNNRHSPVHKEAVAAPEKHGTESTSIKLTTVPKASATPHDKASARSLKNENQASHGDKTPPPAVLDPVPLQSTAIDLAAVTKSPPAVQEKSSVPDVQSDNRSNPIEKESAGGLKLEMPPKPPTPRVVTKGTKDVPTVAQKTSDAKSLTAPATATTSADTQEPAISGTVDNQSSLKPVAQTGESSASSDGQQSEVMRENIKKIFSKARHNKPKDVEELLDQGVSPDARDAFGNTLLIIASQNGHKPIMKLLIKRSCDLNAQNNKGQTPLHFCFAYGYTDLGEWLVSKGANDQIRNMYGLTCYEGLGPR
jgi:hypothetical protein